MGRRPSLTALVIMDCSRCVSEARPYEPPPDWRSVQQPIDQCDLGYIPQGIITQTNTRNLKKKFFEKNLHSPTTIAYFTLSEYFA